MRIARSQSELSLDRNKSIALVPTMGAFHEGHVHLMRRARDLADTVVVSLFVNPTQFRPGEDFESYPRDEERDFQVAREAGVNVVFAPPIEDMYPEGAGTTVHVVHLSARWEGAARPGHFDGVATVVAKLFNIVRPTVAVFGLKDFQQCRVLSAMVVDLNFPVELAFEETVRDRDGLALSSRNAYLNSEERALAPLLYQTLIDLSFEINHDFETRTSHVGKAKQKLVDSGFEIGYLELVNALTLEPSPSANVSKRLIAAVRLGNTRLIDNVAV